MSENISMNPKGIQVLFESAAYAAGSAALSQSSYIPLSLQDLALCTATNTVFSAAAHFFEKEEASTTYKVALHALALISSAVMLATLAKPIAFYTAIQLTPTAIAQMAAFHGALKLSLCGLQALSQKKAPEPAPIVQKPKSEPNKVDIASLSKENVIALHSNFLKNPPELTENEFALLVKRCFDLNLPPLNEDFELPTDYRQPTSHKDVQNHQALYYRNYFHPANFNIRSLDTQLVVNQILQKFENTKDHVHLLSEPEQADFANLSKPASEALKAQFENAPSWDAKTPAYQKAFNQALKNHNITPIHIETTSTWKKVGAVVVGLLALGGPAAYYMGPANASLMGPHDAFNTPAFMRFKTNSLPYSEKAEEEPSLNGRVTTSQLPKTILDGLGNELEDGNPPMNSKTEAPAQPRCDARISAFSWAATKSSLASLLKFSPIYKSFGPHDDFSRPAFTRFETTPHPYYEKPFEAPSLNNQTGAENNPNCPALRQVGSNPSKFSQTEQKKVITNSNITFKVTPLSNILFNRSAQNDSYLCGKGYYIEG